LANPEPRTKNQEPRTQNPDTSKTSFADRPPECIVAIVTLAGSNELVAVSAEAELLILRPNGEWQSERIPHRGSPRSLAAHPTAPWVAVGIKQGGFAKPESVVGLFELEP
jgi:hypothetical protein